jgi:chromosomal replication initiator protein
VVGVTDFADQIIAALEGPRGPEIAALVVRRACAMRVSGLDAVMALVAKSYGVGVEQLRGRRVDRMAVEPRSVAVYLARSLTGASYQRIGRALCRDHTTIRSAYLRVERKMETDPDLRDLVQSLRDALVGSGNIVPVGGLG